MSSTSWPSGTVRNGNAERLAQQLVAAVLYSSTAGCAAQPASAEQSIVAARLFNAPSGAVLDPDFLAIGRERAFHHVCCVGLRREGHFLLDRVDGRHVHDFLYRCAVAD